MLAATQISDHRVEVRLSGPLSDPAMNLHRMNGGLHIRIAGTSLGEMRVGGRICIPVIQ